MVIQKKPIDIVSLVKDNNGCIELTKELYKSLYSRTRLTEAFLLEQKKQLAKFDVYITETDRKSLLFSTPNKTFNNRFTFIANVNTVTTKQQAEDYECRVCDVKLFEALYTASDLMEDLVKYKDARIKIDNKFTEIFYFVLDQWRDFYLSYSINNVMDGLHDVKNNHLTPSGFIAKYEEFHDHIRDDSIFEGIDLRMLEDVNDDDDDDGFYEDDGDDDRDDIPEILEILDGVRLALGFASEELYLFYIDHPVLENSP
jgi:hypothetical protein